MDGGARASLVVVIDRLVIRPSSKESNNKDLSFASNEEVDGGLTLPNVRVESLAYTMEEAQIPTMITTKSRCHSTLSVRSLCSVVLERRK